MTNSYAGNILRAQRLGHIPNIPYAVVIESSTYQTIKPEEKIFRIAIEKTGMLPGQLLLIDDLELNVKQAASLGMNAFHFDPQNVQASIAEISNHFEKQASKRYFLDNPTSA